MAAILKYVTWACVLLQVAQLKAKLTEERAVKRAVGEWSWGQARPAERPAH